MTNAVNEIQKIRTTCAYCGVGCGVLASVDTQNRQVTVEGDRDHPANFGKLCSKGSALGHTLDLDRRLATPLLHGAPVSWDTVTTHLAQRFNDIIATHGSDSILLYVSGQLLTEDYYVANKFAKGFLGTNNIDSNSRLCMSSAVAGYKRAFGTDTVPCSYSDIEDSELFVLIGSNMAWCHPILFGRLKASKAANPNKKIVVIDPRATDSTLIADLHLPIRAGTDSHLFNGLLHYLHTQGHGDAAFLSHCDGLTDALEASASWHIEKVAKYCGVDVAQLRTFYHYFATTQRTVTFYSMGVNQSSNGTDKVNAIINCHLYTGKLGYPGAGPFSITGQPNAMGGREVGALANLLASHFELKSPSHRRHVAKFWQAPRPIAAHDGIKATQAADAILEGKIKAIWIIATNPVVSLPEADKFAMALKQCELVVVSDCSKDSDTLDFAHVALPAQGWSEKSGTVTNSERRISRQRRLLPAFAESKPDWWIVSQVAKKMGFAGFDYQSEHEVFLEHAALSGYKNASDFTDHPDSSQQNSKKNTTQDNPPNDRIIRSFDISHLATLSAEEYEHLTPWQWGHAQYFSLAQLQQGQSYTDTHKLHFVPIAPSLPKSLPNARFPFSLNTGRLRDQWHTMTRTAIAAQLNQHLPQPFISIHPSDAQAQGIAENDFVKVTSSQGHVLVRARLHTSQRRSDVFIPMHWNNHFTANARVGKLIDNHIDPYSQQPELKHTPVRLEPVTMAGYARLLIHKNSDDALLSWLDDPAISYWVRNRQAHSSEYLLAVADNSAHADAWFQPTFWQHALTPILNRLLTEVLSNPSNNQPNNQPNNQLSKKLEVISYQDAKTNDVRLAWAAQTEQNTQHIMAVLFVSPNESQLPSHQWLDSTFAEPLDTLTRKWLLAGRAAVGFVDVGRIICSCMSVGENTIIDTIAAHDCTSASEVGKHCKAGTNCGSCVGEINRLLAAASA